MNRLAAASAAILLLAAGEAHAGPASDALGKCLVESSTGRDRVAFMRWMFGAMAQHPDVGGTLATVTPERYAEISKAAAAMVDRLVLKDCRAEAIAALREDSANAMRAPFETFGRMAMQELMGNETVNRQMDSVGALLDEKGWAALSAEASPAR